VSTPTQPVLRIFLASPGDLNPERVLAKRVVDDINRGLARELSWHVDLLGWEDSLPGYIRPQEKINRDVDSCELFIGLLYERWGTPTGKYSSGFEEEFVRATARREESGSEPEIWLFFKKMHPKLVRDPGEEATKIIAFRDERIAEKKLLFRDFESSEDWERILTHTLSTELAKRAMGVPDSVDVPAATADVDPSADSPELADDESAGSARRDLAGVASAITKAAECLVRGDTASLVSDVPTLVRINLMTAAALSHARTGNTYNAHDINLAYRLREGIELVDRDLAETSLVLRTVFTLAENVTGWYWLRSMTPETILRYAAVRATTDQLVDVRIGALKILQRNGEVPDGLDVLTFFASVFADSSARVRRTGLQVLQDVGLTHDQFRELLDAVISVDDELSQEATDVLVRLEAGLNPQRALELLAERSGPVPDSILSKLRGSIDRVSDDELTAALEATSPDVRALTATTLLARGALGTEAARALLKDPSGVVREAVTLAAFPGLVRADLDSALEDLPTDSAVLVAGSSRREAMLRSFFERMTYDELVSHVDWFSPSDGAPAYEALAVHHFKRFWRQLRKDLRDAFEPLKERSTERLVARNGSEGAELIVSQFSQYDDFIRSAFTVAALRGLLANGTARDADLARSCLGSSGYRVRETALLVLARLAQSEDTDLLLEAAIAEFDNGRRMTLALGGLRAAPREQLDELRERLLDSKNSDLVRMALETRVAASERTRIAARAEALTYNEDPTTRGEAVRYLAKNLSDPKLEAFLGRYVEAGRYFYNVVSWLDRVLYAPDRIRVAFREELLS
jgi:hypothetical protein